MLGQPFYYHSLIRKYVAVFGSLFNDIHVQHNDVNGNFQDIIVPIAYGPRARYIERNRADPNLKSNRLAAAILPRMAYEIINLNYAKNRKLNTLNRECGPDGSIWAGQPWDFVFKLSILTVTVTDANQIAEQILPFFTPGITRTVELIPELGIKRDIPIMLNDVTFVDTYAEDWSNREFCLFELVFTLEGWLYGPVFPHTGNNVIKFANVTIYPTSANTFTPNADAKYLRVTVQPGLTANGQPTTDITQTIPYLEIEADDPWDFIVQYTEN